MFVSLIFAGLAGALSILSPCVLPLLPIVLGTAGSQSKFGPWALGAGVVISFVTVGLFVALVGFSIGLDGNFFRSIAAVILVAIGLALLIPRFQTYATKLAGPISAWGQNRLNSFSGAGALGQFGVGILLGTVWSPCVGPTLGAASLLAAQGKDLGHVIATMLAFALGVSVPLISIGIISRQLWQKSRSGLLVAGNGLKVVLGVLLIGLGTLILSHLDKQVEAALVDLSPAWLTALTTTF